MTDIPQGDPQALGAGQELQLRILVVDDNPINVTLARLMLERLGYRRTDAVSNGQEALDALDQHAYDVILMDLYMPVLGGLEATEQIEARLPFSRRPLVIGMTAITDDDIRQTCIDAGMIDYVSKPVVAKELGAALERAAHLRGVQAKIEDVGLVAGGDSTANPDPEILDELAQPFIADAVRSLKQIVALVRDQDAAALERAAHRLRGGCQIVGALEMARLCEELEQQGSSGSTSGASELLAALEEQFQIVRSRLSTPKPR